MLLKKQYVFLANNTTEHGDLHKVLKSANLLSYYEAFLSKGGDDIHQLLDADEEELDDIMEIVGMASKPLHVKRLKRALDEWELNHGKNRMFPCPAWVSIEQKFALPALSELCNFFGNS